MEKYNQEFYRNIIINRNAVGEIKNIETAVNAKPEDAIIDAITYLHDIKDSKAYIFIYKHARCLISSKHDSAKLIGDFIGNYNHVTEELSIEI